MQDLLLLGSEYFYVYNISSGHGYLNRITSYAFFYPTSVTSLLAMATLEESSQPNGKSKDDKPLVYFYITLDHLTHFRSRNVLQTRRLHTGLSHLVGDFEVSYFCGDILFFRLPQSHMQQKHHVSIMPSVFAVANYKSCLL
jgi:hypothetical protein